jgi:hypothetical protein
MAKMSRYKRAVAVTGEYVKDGVTKKQYTNVGTLMKYEDGGLAMKMDALPLGDFNGWISFYDFDEERKQGYDKGTTAAREAFAPAGPDIGDGAGNFDDDIPF